MGKKIRRILLAILLAVFVFSAGMAAWIRHQYEESERLYTEASAAFTRPAPVRTPKPAPEAAAEGGSISEAPAEPEEAHIPLYAPIEVDFDALRKVNPDIVGWIWCEDTVIDYPVAQGEDNELYLHHSYDGSYSASGTIFAEAENRRDFADANTILYGHHMKNGSMFASLDRWASQSYYEEHPVMWLLTPTQDYQVVLFSGYTTSAASGTYSVIAEPGPALAQYLEQALAQSDFQAGVTPEPEGKYVLLSTCAYVFNNARYVLHGMLIPLDSAGGVPLS